MTPPAVLVYLKDDDHIKKTFDEGDHRHKDWIIRVIPNLYPAFSPPKQETDVKEISKSPNLSLAIGHHEVLIESQKHDDSPANAPVPQVVHVVNAYIDRLRELSGKPYVKYVSIFRNHGLEAGASLSHAHSQIIATPTIPLTIREEMDASKKFLAQHKKCVFCDVIEKERGGPRLILENSKFVAIAPYASVNPMEFWIIPKKHETSPLQMNAEQIKIFAETLKTCLGGLKTLVNDPPYNYGFHLALDNKTDDHYHWHLEVYPRLAIWAGFEKSTGMYINTMTPETAAESMKNCVST